MKSIIGIGNALVDVMTMLDNDILLGEFLLPKGSMQLVDREKSEMIKKGTSHFKCSLTSGGSAANTIHGLAMLGAKTGFIGSIGRDENGNFFENEMEEAGIDTKLIRRNSMTGNAVALVSPDSERTFATHLGAAIELRKEDMNHSLFNNYDLFYLEGYLVPNIELVEEACKIAKEKKMKIIVDLASYNVVNSNKNDFEYILKKYTDIVFANEEEAKAFTGEEPLKALTLLSEICNIAIVKSGSDGSWIKRGEEIIKISALPVKCIDTTGAGDLYASGFLYGYANDLTLEKCGILGSLLAGNVICNIGARMNKKMWEKVKKEVLNIIEEKE